MAADHIQSFSDCISAQERKQRLSMYLVNALMWLFFLFIILFTLGVFLIPAAIGWVLQYFLAEYNIRKLQALGVTVSDEQLPQVAEAVSAVCERFNVPNNSRVIVIRSGEANAFAIRFARKRVVVILSDLLDSVIEHPAELHALLAHELCHCVLDHGWKGRMMIYKPARFRAGRELTCDNAGLVAAGDLEGAKMLIRKLVVGRRLFKVLSESALISESEQLYSGITGWLLRNYLTHPPAGARLDNLNRFAEETGVPLTTRGMAPAKA
jgi:Zn-dependent protease with chaperone function